MQPPKATSMAEILRSTNEIAREADRPFPTGSRETLESTREQNQKRSAPLLATLSTSFSTNFSSKRLMCWGCLKFQLLTKDQWLPCMISLINWFSSPSTGFFQDRTPLLPGSGGRLSRSFPACGSGGLLSHGFATSNRRSQLHLRIFDQFRFAIAHSDLEPFLSAFARARPTLASSTGSRAVRRLT